MCSVIASEKVYIVSISYRRYHWDLRQQTHGEVKGNGENTKTSGTPRSWLNVWEDNEPSEQKQIFYRTERIWLKRSNTKEHYIPKGTAKLVCCSESWAIKICKVTKADIPFNQSDANETQSLRVPGIYCNEGECQLDFYLRQKKFSIASIKDASKSILKNRSLLSGEHGRAYLLRGPWHRLNHHQGLELSKEHSRVLLVARSWSPVKNHCMLELVNEDKKEQKN